MTASQLRIAVAARTNPGQASGSSRVVERLADGLAARGHEVARVAPEPAPPLGRGPAAAAAIRERMARQHGMLTGWWRERRPDVVYIEYADDFGHVAAQAASGLGLPTVARFHRLHALAPPAEREGLLAQVLRFHRARGATVATTDELAIWLGERGVGNAVTIPNGVDVRRFDPRRRDPPRRAAWGASDDDAVLLWAGRLLAAKDPDLFAEAAEATRAAAPGTRAVVVGDGPERDRLRQRLPWAIFTGSLGDDELAALYASADALLFTSSPDGIDVWGNVVTEAMASGVAPLSYAFGAAAACAVDGVSGRLIAPGQRAAYIAAATELARGPARLREMGAAARAAVAMRTWAAMVERYDALLRRVAGGGG